MQNVRPESGDWVRAGHLVADIRASRGLGYWVWVWVQTPKHKFFLALTNSEFSSIHFGVEMKK